MIVPQWVKRIKFTKSTVWTIGNFIFGLLAGYGLGILRVHEKILHSVEFSQSENLWAQTIEFLSQIIWKPLESFSPSLGFASDVIAYQAAIVAITIPVSLEIISRVSERYQSGAVAREFSKQWQLKTLLVLIFTDALLGVTLKFFLVSEKIEMTAWKVVAWIVFIFFIATNIVLLAFFRSLRQYVTSAKFLLDHFFNDLNQNLSRVETKKQISNKQIEIYKEKIIIALEGMGDILIFESKNKKNIRFVRDGVWKLEEKAKYIFELQKTDSQTFRRLMYSQHFLSAHEPGNSANELEMAVSLEINPEENVLLLGTIINQFIRLHETALESNNCEVAQWSTYSLKQLLTCISQINENYPNTPDTFRNVAVRLIAYALARLEHFIQVWQKANLNKMMPENGDPYHTAIPITKNCPEYCYPLVKILLKVFYDLHYINQDKRDDLIYPLAIGWYVEAMTQREFKFLKYQQPFDQYFIQNLHWVISNQKLKIFKDFLGAIHLESFRYRNQILSINLERENNQYYIEIDSQEHSVGLAYNPTRQNIRLDNQEEYTCLQNSINQKINNNNYKKIRTVVEAQYLSNLLEKIKTKIDSDSVICEKLQVIHNDLAPIFKLNHIVDILFDLGAFCIFKKRYDYLHEFWEFRQTQDSDYAVARVDFTPPREIVELINFYFRVSWEDRLNSFYWEDRHGSQRYYDQYFLLLITRICFEENFSFENLSFDLSDPVRDRLSNDLIPLCKTEETISFLSEALLETGFNSDQVNCKTRNILIPFLEKIGA
jgi:hypothetical protein